MSPYRAVSTASTWNPASLASAFSTQLQQFGAKYTCPGTRDAPTPLRRLVRLGDSAEGRADSRHPARHELLRDPESWIANSPGFMTGSGIPMPFADLDGSTVDVYQAPTQMNDEAGQRYPFTVDALLDRALGPEGYYGFFVANMHADVDTSPKDDAVLAAAQAHGVPVISAKQLLTWLDAREASSFGSLSWSGATMSFTIDADNAATGLRAMLPTRARNGTLSGLTRGGAPVAYETQTIKASSTPSSQRQTARTPRPSASAQAP